MLKAVKHPSLAISRDRYERLEVAFHVLAGFLSPYMGIAFLKGQITYDEAMEEATYNKMFKIFLGKPKPLKRLPV